jgi:hypothetical protein
MLPIKKGNSDLTSQDHWFIRKAGTKPKWVSLRYSLASRFTSIAQRFFRQALDSLNKKNGQKELTSLRLDWLTRTNTEFEKEPQQPSQFSTALCYEPQRYPTDRTRESEQEEPPDQEDEQLCCEPQQSPTDRTRTQEVEAPQVERTASSFCSFVCFVALFAL